MVNEELTAEEWKRRYEKEKEKNGRLKAQLARFEAELNRWRQGEDVPQEDQMDFKQAATESKSESTTPSTASAPGAPIGISNISNDERVQLEQEKQRLYQMLDDKVKRLNDVGNSEGKERRSCE